MNHPPTLDRILTSLHDASLDDALWATTSALLDEACRTKGNLLTLAEGNYPNDVDIYIVRFYSRGERQDAVEHEYFTSYYAKDERIPRLLQLPDSHLVHATDLYSDEEFRTSAAFNESLSRSNCQNSLNVRLDGPNGSRITWTAADPIDADGWSSSQIEFIRRLLPHLRQYVRVRRALADAGALGVSLTGLLDNAGIGIFHLDRRGRIVEANDLANDLLREGDALFDRRGVLGARSPDADAVFQSLIARAIPRFRAQGASGSLMIGRPNHLPGLTVHVSPVGGQEIDVLPWRVAALVLVVDHAPTRVDPAVVEALLGLSPAESKIAVLLTEGRTPRDIAMLTGRKESTVRWHVQQIFQKRGISRQVELVRQVLTLAALPRRRG